MEVSVVSDLDSTVGMSTTAMTCPWDTGVPTSTSMLMMRPALIDPACTRAAVTWALLVETKWTELYHSR